MEHKEIIEETPELIYMRRDDERIRIVVARTGDYAEIHYQDSVSGRNCTMGASYAAGRYRVDPPWESIIANSWEKLVVAYAREMRRVGTVAVAYPLHGSVTRFEV